jgi:glyoxylase-like metal-dependent hydrolase (beta-lactamase superfamily II)
MESDAKFNDYCYQIDIKQWGLPQVGTVYVAQSQKTALIDSGTGHTVRDIQKALVNFKIDQSKIDYMIITHEHYDHGAGAALLLEKMPNAEVYASAPTAKVLKAPEEIQEKTKQYYGEAKALVSPYPPVKNVNIIKEGYKFDLGKGITLEVRDFKGHTPGSIGLFEAKTKTLFAGDAVCVYNVEFDFYLPPSYPDLFDYQTYLTSLKKISAVDFNYLCIGHFGTLMPPKAKQVIKRAGELVQDWKEIITKTYRETRDENKVYEAIMAKYGQNKYIARFPEMIRKSTLGQMIKGYLLSLKLT